MYYTSERKSESEVTLNENAFLNELKIGSFLKEYKT